MLALNLVPGLVTSLYTDRIFQSIAGFLRSVSGKTTFPIGQFVFYFLLLLLLAIIMISAHKESKKKQSKTRTVWETTKNVVAYLAVIYFALLLLWGINYAQYPIEKKLGLDYASKYSQRELEELTDELITKTNAIRHLVEETADTVFTTGYSNQQLFSASVKALQSMPSPYDQFQYHTPSVKAVKIPQLMSFFGVAGIYFPFTGEANVNTDIPDVLMPSTACHEMAHQMGIAEEGEANYLAYIACTNYDDPAFQYSGYYLALHYCMRGLYKMDSISYKKRKKQCHPGIRRDARHLQRFWKKYENPIEPWTDKFYDYFLKANQQKKGIESYSGVVALILADKRRQMRP